MPKIVEINSNPTQSAKCKPGRALILPLILAIIGGLWCDCDAKKSKQPDLSFKREETMILNLEKAPKSAKHVILTCMRSAKAMEKELDRAIRQVQSADETFAKATNKRDSRTMNGTVERLKAALATTQQLQDELDLANKELRSDVQQTLISR